MCLEFISWVVTTVVPVGVLVKIRPPQCTGYADRDHNFHNQPCGGHEGFHVPGGSREGSLYITGTPGFRV